MYFSYVGSWKFDFHVYFWRYFSVTGKNEGQGAYRSMFYNRINSQFENLVKACISSQNENKISVSYYICHPSQIKYKTTSSHSPNITQMKYTEFGTGKASWQRNRLCDRDRTAVRITQHSGLGLVKVNQYISGLCGKIIFGFDNDRNVICF